MRVNRQFARPIHALACVGIIVVCCVAGCYSPRPRSLHNELPAFAAPIDSTSSAQILPGATDPVIVAPPQSDDASMSEQTASNVETWVVHTRACEQKMGSDPWSSITIGRLDDAGGPLHSTEPQVLLSLMTGRPCVFFIHGNGYTYRTSVEEAVKIRAVLEANGGFTADTLVIVFDWPSEQEPTDLITDLNEQARRSRIASYHFARFLQSSPPNSRICLMGVSNGGRISLTTMHLLSGAILSPFWGEPEVQLTSGRPDLRMRAVLLDTAAGHHWLNPGERLDQALPMCEAVLNLRNCGDYALSVYVLGVYTGLRPALGQVGFLPSDIRRLGTLASRLEQYNLHSEVGFSHTSFPQALDLPEVAERIARYTSWNSSTLPARR